MTLLWLFLLGAAVGRLTRLIVDDTILDRPRCWFVPKLPCFLQDLVGCPWCISGELSILAVIWYWSTRSLEAPFAHMLAVWWVACATYWLTEFLAAKTADSGKVKIEEDVDVHGFWEEHG